LAVRPRKQLRRAEALDRQIVARIAATKSPILDVLPRFGETANHSVLWLAVSLGLAATGNRRARRAALRGMAGVVIASTAANVVAKGLTGRARPVSDTPVLRRLVHAPKTTSFPSGHSASAAAFATGVALELPQLAVPVGAAAAAVGVSRVVTGVHYPSDVVAGFAIGAAAGAVTLRWWPLRPARPAEATRPRQQAPAAPTGAGLVLAVNAASGGTSADLAGRLRGELPDAEIIDVGDGEDIEILLRGAARRAQIKLLFAGNCCYAPPGFAPSYRPDLSDGLLDVRLVDAKLPLARLRLLLAVLTGTLGRSRVYRAWAARAMEIASADGVPIRLSVDGEAIDAGASTGWRNALAASSCTAAAPCGARCVAAGCPRGARPCPVLRVLVARSPLAAGTSPRPGYARVERRWHDQPPACQLGVRRKSALPSRACSKYWRISSCWRWRSSSQCALSSASSISSAARYRSLSWVIFC
jgi:membrane-associated phospholipid phosphatase